MKVIVAGGRYYNDYKNVEQVLNNILSLVDEDVEIVSGACDTGVHTFTRADGTKVYGADGLGERYAKEHGIPVKLFPAQWNSFGKKAGYIRNNQMAEYGTHCVCFWDRVSKGTKMMIDLAVNKGLTTRTIYYK